MATVTGTNLLDFVLAETGAAMSGSAGLVTAARLQQMINTGFDNGLSISLVLSAASSEIRTASPVLPALVTVVDTAKTAISGSEDTNNDNADLLSAAQSKSASISGIDNDTLVPLDNYIVAALIQITGHPTPPILLVIRLFIPLSGMRAGAMIWWC